jgi:CHAD domain-containing protein
MKRLAMPPVPGKPASQAERKRQPRGTAPRLNAGMSCGAAFRAIARNCLKDFTANHAATCRNSHVALHRMRVALTRLRAAVSFFSPMLADTERVHLKRELKWLNGHLGTARDMDVAIELLKQNRQRASPDTNVPTWKTKRAESRRQLTQALGSHRYRRLIADVSAWIENGPWTRSGGKAAAKRRETGITRYGTRKLARWRKKLLKKSRKLQEMTPEKQHRIRLASKRLRYAIEFFAGLLAHRNSPLDATLKCLRQAQTSLGELNDAHRVQPSPVLDDKRRKHLTHVASHAYRKLAALKPLRI